ncbi:hypothetical protein DV532_25790 (plasmid) [Pseudomonas sp. Leaf58]|uniref:hypothetical protein n=1 Tax=unclassified Pseudomonas TaxID=196821 RepID=UPI0006F91028|nr:hypothetical protein [Pseudomonas sp. Leaf58]AYG47708.1 hypothetical protein DV532_25790 [Pseudomonas sp. Leaf58]KQN62729.1 hypothetical protein ASF02_11330 [Pseudomonas sp. Leaf58]
MPKLQASELTAPANLDLLHRFALRIHSLSSAMGLDAMDEQLLWEFLAKVGPERIESDCAPIARFLKKAGEGEALHVKAMYYTLKMDERFDRRPWWKKTTQPLFKKGQVTIDQVVAIERPESQAYFDQIIENIKAECFSEWYPHLKSIPRENGVDWNPPETSDIAVHAICSVSVLVPANLSNLQDRLTCGGTILPIR